MAASVDPAPKSRIASGRVASGRHVNAPATAMLATPPTSTGVFNRALSSLAITCICKRYVWHQRHHQINRRQQFHLVCDNVFRKHSVTKRYGAPRLTDELRAQGYQFNVKTVAASLRRQGLRAKASRRFPSGQLPQTWSAGLQRLC